MYTPTRKPKRSNIASRDYNVQWVTQNLQVRGHSGDEYDVLCVSHDDSNASCRVNVTKGVSFCHGCGVSLPLPALARVIGVPYSSGDRTEVDMAELMRKLDSLRSNRGYRAPRFLPETDLKRYDFPTRYWTDPIKQDGTGGRGFTEDTVSAFDLGYDPLNDIATIPIRNMDGNLMGFTRRFLAPDAEKRYRDPRGFDKSRNLFASHFAARDDCPCVVLTEGPLDCIKVWQAGHASLAQFGSNLTASQIKLLREMNFLSVILFYDNDTSGQKVTSSALGWAQQDVKGKRVWVYNPEHDLRRFFVVKLVRYRHVSAKDPGGMIDADITRLVTSAELVYSNRGRQRI